MQRTTMTAFGIGLALGGLALGATAAAQPGAVAEGTSAAVFAADDNSDGGNPGGMDAQRPQETPLTGADADAATAAAEAAVPDGTVLRVETDADGGGVYEAHVRTSDGTEVVVLMDENFTVTSVEEHLGRGHGGPRQTPLTGADADAATAAAEAAVPDGTVLRVETDADGGGVYEAHVRTSDGTEVVVLMDENFTVTSVEEHLGRGHGGPGHGGPGHGGPGHGSDGAADSAADGSTSASSYTA